jgi:hypothetical protein
VTHLTLWLLIAIGVVTSTVLVIGNSVLSFAATALLAWMVVVMHRRLGHRGSVRRLFATVVWKGPYDPVGRLVYLPVRIPESWQALRRGGAAGGPAVTGAADQPTADRPAVPDRTDPGRPQP